LAAGNLARQDTFSKPDPENASELVFQIRFYRTALSTSARTRATTPPRAAFSLKRMNAAQPTPTRRGGPRAPLPGSTCLPATRAVRMAERTMD